MVRVDVVGLSKRFGAVTALDDLTFVAVGLWTLLGTASAR